METDENENITNDQCSEKSRKRKKHGRISDVAKQLRLCSHEAGEYCYCKRLKCFEKINDQERKTILKEFNQLKSTDEQNAYLCGLITTKSIQRRRPRKDEDEALLHYNSYSYRVRMIRNGEVVEIPICFKAFLSIHGITKKKLEYLQCSLRTIGSAPRDLRGKHSNRPRKLSEDTYNCVISHISSFKGRKSHYSLTKTDRLYLSEDLNISKMHKMYREKFPNHVVSYESYRTIFSSKFNISFGYPRKDTCSACDEYEARKRNLQLQLRNYQHKMIFKAVCER